MTINAARALALEDEIGSIEAGKAADLVIWRVPDERRRSPTTRARTWCGPSSSAAASSWTDPERDRRGRGQACLPRDSRRTVTVSAGRLDAVTDSFGWVTGSAPISWKNLASTSAQSASSSHNGIGTTIFGSSWAISAAALVGLERTAERHAGDIDRADVADLLLRQQVADLAEVDGVDPVDLDHERDALAVLRPARIVAVRPHAGDEDLLDLVLARAVEDERAASRLEGTSVVPSRDTLPFGLPRATGASSGWLNVTMSPVIPRPVGPTTD